MNTTSCTEINCDLNSINNQQFAIQDKNVQRTPLIIEHSVLFSSAVLDNTNLDYALTHDSISCDTLFDRAAYYASSETLCENDDITVCQSPSIETLFNSSSVLEECNKLYGHKPDLADIDPIRYSEIGDPVCRPNESYMSDKFCDCFHTICPISTLYDLIDLYDQEFDPEPSVQRNFEFQMKNIEKKPTPKVLKGINSVLKAYQTRPDSRIEETLIKKMQKGMDIKLRQSRDEKKLLHQFQMNPFGPFKLGLDEPSLDALNGFTDAISNLSTKVPDPKSIPGVVHSITNVLAGDFMSAMKDIPFLIALIVTGTNFLSNPTKQNASILVVSVCAYLIRFHSNNSFSLYKDILAPFAKCVLKYMRDTEEFENQMSDGELSGVMELMTFASYAYFSKSAPEGKKLEKLLKLVGDFKKTSEGSFNVAKFVIGFIEIVTNYVRTEVLNLNSIAIMEPDNKELQNHSEAVRNIMDLLHKDKLTLNVANAEKIYNLWCRGNDLIGRLPGNRENASLRSAFTVLQNQLTKIKDIFESAHLLNTGVRMVPYTILIRGPSGVGKSVVTTPLVLAFLAIVLDEANIPEFLENHNSFLYSRQHEQVYWDGYRGQFVCVYDDFGQSRSVPGVPDDEFMNLIRSSNIFPNSLHMADLISKGNTYFRSSIIVCTTNMWHIKPDSIIEPEAIQRRFNTVVDMLPKPGYCFEDSLQSGGLWGRRLDKSKTGPGFDEAAVEFHEFSFKTDKHTGRVWTFDGMIKEMVRVYREHQFNHVQYSSIVETVKRDYVARRAIFEQQMDIAPAVEIEGETTDAQLNRFKLFYRRVPIPVEAKLALVDMISEILPECSLETLTLDIFGLVQNDLKEFCTWLSLHQYSPHALFVYIRNKIDAVGEQPTLAMVNVPRNFTERAMRVASQITTVLLDIYMKTIEVLERYPPLSWVFDFISPLTADFLAGAIIGVCVNVVSNLACKAVVNLFKFVCNILGFNVPTETSPQASGSSGRGKKNRSEQLKFIRSIREHHAHVNVSVPLDAQAAFKNDTTNVQIVDKIVSRNSYELWLPGALSRAGVITFVRGRLAIMPWHFVMRIAEAISEDSSRASSYIILKKIGTTIELKVPILTFLDAKQVTNFETLDICLVDLNVANVQNHCDITPYFVPMAQATKSNDFFVRLCVPGVKGNENWCTKAAPQNNKVVGTDPDEQTVIRFGYNYSAMTKVGDCGGILTLVDPTSGMRKILGIHTCGSPSQGLGFSSAVFLEDLLDCIGLFESQIIEEIHFETQQQSSFVVGDGRFESLYVAPKRVNIPTKTKIQPSLVADMWGPRITAPAALIPVLHEGVQYDPMYNALSKYCTQDVVVDPFLLNLVETSLSDDIRRTSVSQFESVVLSFEQAIVGIEGEDFNAISRNTSCGYPHNVNIDGRFPGKTKFFGSGDTYDLNNDECLKLKSRVSEIENNAANLIRGEHVFTDYLKDERRPIAKTLIAKTRLISACPLELLILYRMYFGSYVLFCQDNCVGNGFATGMNPYSNQWQDLAKNLLSKGPYIGAGDYTAFDGSEKPCIHNAILNVIENFYQGSDRDRSIRKVLWLELVNSKHISGDKIYAWFSSLPSGHPLTTVVNNHYNHIAFRLVWLHVHGNDPLCLSNFNDHVYLATLGDDNIFSVSLDKINIFNESILESTLPKFGLTYTNEAKIGASHVSRDLTEVSFLKRTFRYEPILDRFVAPLNLDVILEMPYWTVRGKLENTIPCDTFETALMELSLHGETTFNAFAPKMLKAFAQKYNYHPKTSSRYTLVLKSATIEESW